LEIASRLLNGNQVSVSGYRFRLRIRNLGYLDQLIDIFGRYREYPLGQLSLHLVKARLLGVIAFCIAGEFASPTRMNASLLTQAAHCADTMDLLQKQVDRDGTTVRTHPAGPSRPHPALAELRSQQSTYMQLVDMLGLPAGVTLGEAPPRTRATKFEMGKRQLRGLPGGLA
jgi:hypothetical protein